MRVGRPARSVAGRIGPEIAARPVAIGPTINPSKNHPQVLRPLLPAIPPASSAQNIQTTIDAISIPLPHRLDDVLHLGDEPGFRVVLRHVLADLDFVLPHRVRRFGHQVKPAVAANEALGRDFP